jgi:hypothetical protein
MSQTLRSPRHEALRALIVEKRKKAGLTQGEVAKRLKRYQSFIATVESGSGASMWWNFWTLPTPSASIRETRSSNCEQSDVKETGGRRGAHGAEAVT